MGISTLCQRDANLLTAEEIFDFMYRQLEIVGSEFSFELLQNLRRRFNDRLQCDIIIVMKYLLKPYSVSVYPLLEEKKC